MRSPPLFYCDFAILDECGRNLQMDIIFRMLPESGPGEAEHVESEGGFFDLSDKSRAGKTMRTCLQDYNAYNSHAKAPVIGLCPSDLTCLPPDSSVHLLHFVLSEEDRPQSWDPLPITGVSLLKTNSLQTTESTSFVDRKDGTTPMLK